MVEVADLPPTTAQVEQAKEDYKRAFEVLRAHRLALELDEKQLIVGKCFKYVEHLAEDEATTWPVYVAVVSLDLTTAQLSGWHFQHAPTGQLEIANDATLQPGFLNTQCLAIERSEFITAFNELLTAVAHFATRMPE